MVKGENSGNKKNVLSGQNLATAMRNSDYDFPSKICINKLLLNSERKTAYLQ